ncbi:MAG: cation diffusion facilitator family transporter [Candidatus Margulisbacteria bacterium]|nr:cation diffusion facilitator family transporter [Candidatus Margulisiibacteriota bacterium]
MFSKYLVSLFFKKNANQNDPILRKKVADLEVYSSTFINILLFILKLTIGIISGSFSMISDAMHTLSDIISSAFVWASFLWSAKPADEEHPFGHGKAEYLGGFIVAVLLMVVGFEFIKESIIKILHPEDFIATPLIILLIIVTILLKELSAQFSYGLGDYISSKTLKADAWHHRTDALSSIIVLLAFCLQYFGITGVDGWAGLIVSVFIFYTGIEVAKDSINPLIGEATDNSLIHKIKKIALEHSDVINAHDVVIHSYGHTKACCLHIEIDATTDSMSVHTISENVEEALVKSLGFTSVTIHPDPVTTNFGKYEQLPKKIALIVKEDNRIESFHDLRLVGKKNILVDLVPEKKTTSEEIIALKKDFYEQFKKLYPELNLKLKIEPKFHY